MDSLLYIQTTGVEFFDISLTPQEPKIPDFKVSTEYYQVENGINWGRLGDTDEYFWETPDEKGNK